jgi:glycosyltransferase involved in cell wall biosynthesis
LKTALGFGLPAVATDIIDDPFLHIIPDRCMLVPTNSPSALAEEIAKQLNLPIQETDQIKLLVDRSWEKMLAVIEQESLQKSQT